MENRKAWSLVLLIIVFMSSAGAYLEYGISVEYATLYALVNFVIVSFIMMLAPFIEFKCNKEPLEYKEGKRICAYNSLTLFIIAIIIMIVTKSSVTIIGGVGAVFYYFINMCFFTYPKNYDKEKNNKKIAKIEEEKIEKQIEKVSNVDNNMNVKKNKKEYKKIKSKTDDTVKNTTNNYIFYAFIAILLIIIIAIGSCYFYEKNKSKNKIQQLENQVVTLKNRNTKLTQEKNDELVEKIKYSAKIKFLDENIVFVLDGYGKYYYTYDQMQEVTQGKKYSYWAYNKEQAIGKGYIAWK